MMRREEVLVVSFVLLSFVFFGTFGAWAQTSASPYTITDLGALPNGKNSYARGINDVGQVVGYSDTAECAAGNWECNEYPHAFLWENGQMRDLGTLEPGFSTYGFGINNRGHVVGYGDTSSNSQGSAFFHNGSLSPLGGISPGAYSQGLAINDEDVVVGLSSLDGGNHAVLWEGSGVQSLGLDSKAKGINRFKKIVGESRISGNVRAFLWSITGTTISALELGTLGGSQSWASQINNMDQAVGASLLEGDETQEAFLWQNGVMTRLRSLGGNESIAYGINDQGFVVGRSNTSNPDEYHAFIWKSTTGMQDLNGHIAPGSGWILAEAHAINSRGQIVGWGKRDFDGDGIYDAERAFLLTPVQEDPIDNTVDVDMDIRPWNFHNKINKNAHWSLIPVAILSNPNFNAPQMVKQKTLTFGRTGEEDSLAFCPTWGWDVNHDGKKDLVCYFYERRADFQCGDTEGILKGMTKGGKEFSSRDDVQVGPCPPRKTHKKR